MAQRTPEEIRASIEKNRVELGTSLEKLRGEVVQLTDWRSQLRRNAFVSSAMNNLNQGVVMTDAQRRVIFCNDRYLEIYGLARSDLWTGMTGYDILELRRRRCCFCHC